jgi:hypothetical protein
MAHAPQKLAGDSVPYPLSYVNIPMPQINQISAFLVHNGTRLHQI